MEGKYAVTFGQTEVGIVQMKREGLYWRFWCRCQLSGDVVCRLVVQCGNSRESLGVVVPEGDGFRLDTRLPVKKLEPGEPRFTLVPRHETGEGHFVPLHPEEPFAYIARLKDAYFVRRYGQAGMMIPDVKK